MKITVVGTGYVGLVTGTCLAETGNSVTCVDIDEKKVNKLKSGQITIYEPGLEKLFDRNLKEDRLSFTTNLADGIKEAQIIYSAYHFYLGHVPVADLHWLLRHGRHYRPWYQCCFFCIVAGHAGYDRIAGRHWLLPHLCYGNIAAVWHRITTGQSLRLADMGRQYIYCNCGRFNIAGAASLHEPAKRSCTGKGSLKINIGKTALANKFAQHH